MKNKEKIIPDVEKYYKHIVDNVPGAMIVFGIENGLLQVRYISDNCVKISGFTPEETYERAIESPVEDALPEDRHMFFGHTWGDEEKELSFKYRIICKNGKYKWVYLSLSKVEEDGEILYYGVLRDVDDEHKKEEEIKEKEYQSAALWQSMQDMYYSILDETKAMITIIDAENYEVLYANKAAIDAADVEQYIGCTCYQGIHHADAPCKDCLLLKSEDMLVEVREAGYKGRYYKLMKKRFVWNQRKTLLEYSEDITEQYLLKKMENELRRNKKKEETLISSIPGGIAIYRLKKDGRVTTDYVSDGLGRMCGYTASEFLEILRDDSRVNILPEDIGKVQETVSVAMAQNKEIDVTYSVYSKEKKPILIRLNANAIQSEQLLDDDVAVLYAVHTRVNDKTKKALEEQTRYRTLINAMSLAFVEMEDGKMVYASERYFDYELSKQDPNLVIADMADRSVVHPDDVELLEEFFKQIRNEKAKHSLILRMKMKDGSYKWTELLLFFDQSEDGKKRGSGILRDIDKEQIEQNERLRIALGEAKRANQSTTDFLSRMSHDMRTPMNGILGIAEISNDENNVANLKENMKKIKDSGKYLLGLINDTLDYQKIQSGRMTLNLEIVDAGMVVKNITEMVQATARQKGVSFEVKLNTVDTNWYIRADEMRLEQVFINLLSNAIKFTPKGGKVEWELKLLSREGMISHDLLIVRDTGTGMSKDFLKNRIFLPFSQEFNDFSNQYAGSGLGLSIVKSLVELMGGHIEVESEPGEGSVFKVYLDFERIEQTSVEENLDSEKAEKTAVAAMLEKKHILLVEDHPLNAEIAIKLLQKKGCIVIHAKNGQEALDFFEQSENNAYDVILMDVRMPVMDGIEAAKAIRLLSRADAKTVPIIAMTANAFDEDVKNCLDAGMNAHIAKPINPQTMYETICECMISSQ